MNRPLVLLHAYKTIKSHVIVWNQQGKGEPIRFQPRYTFFFLFLVDRYALAQGNPYKYVDPNGHFLDDPRDPFVPPVSFEEDATEEDEKQAYRAAAIDSIKNEILSADNMLKTILRPLKIKISKRNSIDGKYLEDAPAEIENSDSKTLVKITKNGQLYRTENGDYTWIHNRQQANSATKVISPSSSSKKQKNLSCKNCIVVSQDQVEKMKQKERLQRTRDTLAKIKSKNK